MIVKHLHIILILTMLLASCKTEEKSAMNKDITIYETSSSGNKLAVVQASETTSENAIEIELFPDQKFQEILGFGGAFTQASAHLYEKLNDSLKKQFIEAYFGDSGAAYSFNRTHINSCDFSTHYYEYTSQENDTELNTFSLDADRKEVIPFIKDAQKVSKEGFKILASPWTAPIWMKDNKNRKGGILLPEYYPLWADYIAKYIQHYQQENIPVWGITVQNEPLGNDNNWESMHFTPETQNDLIVNHLGPKLRAQHPEVKILGFDQNRDEALETWTTAMFSNPENAKFYDGTAIHWYASTFEYFPDALNAVHLKAPEKLIIQTEACIDAEIPQWKNDQWYWQKNATDWGWDWAPDHLKHLHPKYAPVSRYAVDIIGCLNNNVNAWIDWNMLLDEKGGPNHAKNWCIAPVIVNNAASELYYTPMYYVMTHFSRFIRPEAVRIGFKSENKQLHVTAVKNKSGNHVVVVYNPEKESKNVQIKIAEKKYRIRISGEAIQTIQIHNAKTT